MAKTWRLLVEVTDDGVPELLSKDEIEAAIFSDLVSGLTGKIVAFVSPFTPCGFEWVGANPRYPKKTYKCARPKHHKDAHCNLLQPEDVK